MTACPRCGFQSAYAFQACPNCLDPTIVIAEEIEDPNLAVRLSDWKAAPMSGCRTQTPFDQISDQGIPYGAAILLSGPAGCGKSTWALRIAAAWEGPAWYFPYERGIDALRRDAERIKVPMDRIWVCSPVASPFKFYGTHGLLIIDSLNTYASRSSDLLDATRQLTGHALSTTSTVIMLAHVTKEWDLAGPERMKHEVDVHIEIVPEMGRDQKTMEPLQLIECGQKNRHGPLWKTLVPPPWVIS